MVICSTVAHVVPSQLYIFLWILMLKAPSGTRKAIHSPLFTLPFLSWVLGLQMCTAMPVVCGAGDWTQGLKYARQAIYQLSYIPGLWLFTWSLLFSLSAEFFKNTFKNCRSSYLQLFTFLVQLLYCILCIALSNMLNIVGISVFLH